MRLNNYAIALMMALTLAPMTIAAKGKMAQRTYMYGFSASFNDSIVYFTDIMAVDSVWIDTKNDFLLGRESYATQLKSYLTNKMGQPNRTCIVISGKNRSKIETDYAKLKKLYSDKANNKYDVRNIAYTDFTFRPVDMSAEEVVEEETVRQKKEKKKERREGGRPRPGDGTPPEGAPMH